LDQDGDLTVGFASRSEHLVKCDNLDILQILNNRFALQIVTVVHVFPKAIT